MNWIKNKLLAIVAIIFCGAVMCIGVKNLENPVESGISVEDFTTKELSTDQQDLLKKLQGKSLTEFRSENGEIIYRVVDYEGKTHFYNEKPDWTSDKNLLTNSEKVKIMLLTKVNVPWWYIQMPQITIKTWVQTMKLFAFCLIMGPVISILNMISYKESARSSSLLAQIIVFIISILILWVIGADFKYQIYTAFSNAAVAGILGFIGTWGLNKLFEKIPDTPYQEAVPQPSQS